MTSVILLSPPFPPYPILVFSKYNCQYDQAHNTQDHNPCLNVSQMHCPRLYLLTNHFYHFLLPLVVTRIYIVTLVLRGIARIIDFSVLAFLVGGWVQS